MDFEIRSKDGATLAERHWTDLAGVPEGWPDEAEFFIDGERRAVLRAEETASGVRLVPTRCARDYYVGAMKMPCGKLGGHGGKCGPH